MKKRTFDNIIEENQPDWYKKIKKTLPTHRNLNLCQKCYCMTYTINGKCGKCKGKKKNESTSIK